MKDSTLLFLFITLFLGCSGILCSPPEYYAPQTDAPYTAEEVTVPTQEGHELVGTLTIPKKVNNLLHGVVLISGSSPQNRDCSPPYHPEYRMFRQIADVLSKRGIIVLRMDERGCG